MGERKINIPGTIDEAVASLTGIGALLTAKEWERAAIVYAFTRNDGPGQPKKNPTEVSDSSEPIEVFAKRGINGLKSHVTVAAYRKAWQEAINQGEAVAAEPGATVALPDLTWESRKAIEATPEPEQETESEIVDAEIVPDDEPIVHNNRPTVTRPTTTGGNGTIAATPSWTEAERIAALAKANELAQKAATKPGDNLQTINVLSLREREMIDAGEYGGLDSVTRETYIEIAKQLIQRFESMRR
jgi:hypothetical protein